MNDISMVKELFLQFRLILSSMNERSMVTRAFFDEGQLDGE